MLICKRVSSTSADPRKQNFYVSVKNALYEGHIVSIFPGGQGLGSKSPAAAAKALPLYNCLITGLPNPGLSSPQLLSRTMSPRTSSHTSHASTTSLPWREARPQNVWVETRPLVKTLVANSATSLPSPRPGCSCLCSVDLPRWSLHPGARRCSRDSAQEPAAAAGGLHTGRGCDWGPCAPRHELSPTSACPDGSQCRSRSPRFAET